MREKFRMFTYMFHIPTHITCKNDNDNLKELDNEWQSLNLFNTK